MERLVMVGHRGDMKWICFNNAKTLFGFSRAVGGKWQ